MEEQTTIEPNNTVAAENMPTPMHDTIREQLVLNLEQTFVALTDTISSFTPDQFNTRPFEYCWSAAQVTDHLLKANGGIVHVVNGPAITTDRSPMQFDPEIRKIFLDFNARFESPVEILPGDQPIEQEVALAATRKVAVGLVQAAQQLDLVLTCTMAEFPGMSYLTRLEWLYFGTYHTLRHTRQMKKILEQLK